MNRSYSLTTSDTTMDISPTVRTLAKEVAEKMEQLGNREEVLYGSVRLSKEDVSVLEAEGCRVYAQLKIDGKDYCIILPPSQ